MCTRRLSTVMYILLQPENNKLNKKHINENKSPTPLSRLTGRLIVTSGWHISLVVNETNTCYLQTIRYFYETAVYGCTLEAQRCCNNNIVQLQVQTLIYDIFNLKLPLAQKPFVLSSIESKTYPNKGCLKLLP